MIVIYHNTIQVTQVKKDDAETLVVHNTNPATVCYELASQFPTQWIVWCHEQCNDYLDHDALQKYLHHKRVMLSHAVQEQPFLTDRIGYIEENPFIQINKDVCYPTWLMHSIAGAVHAAVLNAVNNQLQPHKNFDYFLNSLAKNLQAQGLFCYQVLLLNTSNIASARHISSKQLFHFVKTHYKTQWTLFLLIAIWIFEKKFLVLPFLQSLFYRKQNIVFDPTKINVQSSKSIATATDIDVIIPTMGRATYLYDVLQDLNTQTVLPKKVIIVEQDGDPTGKTQLGYLNEEQWQFEIVHHFIHQTGACNARNIALAETTASWVFFADDDNRFDKHVLEQALQYLIMYGALVLTTSYLQKGEQKVFHHSRQWMTFGSGNSFVRGDLARSIPFDTDYEHGYGEDTDYGMQLRNRGIDILYQPAIDLLHLKAPIGGFRKPITMPWHHKDVAPKPSPTVMLYRLRHTTTQQLKGYKLRLFLRQFRAAKTGNIFAFIKQFKTRWNASVKWATYLDN